MSEFEGFNFKILEDIQRKANEVKADIQFTEDLSPLLQKVKIGPKQAPNSFAILPMEGCDSELDGTPSDLVRRRYRRYASGGAGLIWWEACAVLQEAKANPHQMSLTSANVGSFASLLHETIKIAQETFGPSHRPINILQLTHSGRYSRPEGKATPLVPQHDPILDPPLGISADSPLISDAYLDDLIGAYVQSALLAQEAGYDGVDIKSCHRYLISELLASYTRSGRYGGSFENRTRFPLTIIEEIRNAVGSDFIIASRINVFDAHPFPYGWGVDEKDFLKPNLNEPLKYIGLLKKQGINLLSTSAGNPYSPIAYITRPFDQSIIGGKKPHEHPLESVARLFQFTRLAQAEMEDIPVIGNGYSWLRQFLPYAGAANIANQSCTMVGLGREAFAYPDAPRDIMEKGKMNPRKVCITCSKCTQLMRDHSYTGCVVRDAEIYLKMYNEARKQANG